jgi:hypothetical protein
MSASEDFTAYVRRLESLTVGGDPNFDSADAADLISEVEDFLKGT